MLIKPKEIEIENLDGEKLKFVIGRYPAVEGLELLALLPSNFASFSKQLPQLKPLILKILKFVSVVKTDDAGNQFELELTTQELIDNNCTDATTLLKLCFESINYNTNFYKADGQSLLESIIDKVMARVLTTIQTLTQ